MVIGDTRVETRIAVRARAVLPENMPTHMKLTIPMEMCIRDRGVLVFPAFYSL